MAPRLEPLDPSKVGVFDLPVYSVRELSHRMGRHVDTIKAHIREGRCPARFIGGSVGYEITEEQRLQYVATFDGQERAPANVRGG